MLEATDAGWREQVLAADVPALVLFWAPWSGHCKQFRPIFDEIADYFGERLLCATMNMDVHDDVPRSLKVRTVPTLAFVRGGELVHLAPGVKSAAAVVELIATHLAVQVDSEGEGRGDQDHGEHDHREQDHRERGTAAPSAEPSSGTEE